MEVHIENNLYLESDTIQFVLKEYTGNIDKKGVERYNVHGYFPNIEYALKHVLKMKIMESTATTLSELRTDVAEAKRYIESLFNSDVCTGLVEPVPGMEGFHD